MSERRDKSRMLKPGVKPKSGGSNDLNYKEESGGIDQNLLEKRLEALRDTQESVQGLSLWCQANKRHSSAIIQTWLKILKKSPVEKRLTLFYLANDVVQHAKRKNDAPVVNQWAFAVQKATIQVRTPSSVSTAISRIFKIWEERSVYSKETIADLLALLNNVPAKERVGEKKKPETYTASADKVAAFQTSTLNSKVKLAYRLKSHLGVTFRAKPFVHMDLDNLKSSIKDRSHGMEVIQEIGQLVEQLKASESKLSIEVDERRKIVETAEIAIVHYENVRGEAKIVNSAYKNFTERVESTRDKVIEKFKKFEEMEIDSSPVPSPPPEAPSPPSDNDDNFGVGHANQSQPSISSNNIRNDIMDALKSTMPSAHNNSQGLHIPYPPPNSTTNNITIPPPQHQHYDQSHHHQTIPNLAVMQQQFQQNWGSAATIPTDNFAAMSAMIQQMLPGGPNNYLAMQQPVYPSQTIPSSSSTYHQHPAQPPPPSADVSSIPLPPPDIPIPPLHQQEVPRTLNNNMSQGHHNMTIPNSMNSPPIGPNPYLTPSSSYPYDTTNPPPTNDSNEYVPLPYYKSQQQGSGDLNSSSMSYGPPGSEFDSYNSNQSTPNQGTRYHPYHHHHHDGRSSETSNSSSGPHNHSSSSMLGSPAYSNHSGSTAASGGNDASIRFYNPGGSATGNNSVISPPSVPPGGARTENKPFDPMEMFASALSKNKNSSSGQELMGGSSSLTPVDSGGGTSTAFNPSDSFYSPGGIFDGFADQNVTNTNGGDQVESYSPRKPEMGNFFNPRGGHLRGSFLNNQNPRGHRGGGGRGFSSGFRGRGGRGSPRGSPRGGRGRFQV